MSYTSTTAMHTHTHIETIQCLVLTTYIRQTVVVVGVGGVLRSDEAVLRVQEARREVIRSGLGQVYKAGIALPGCCCCCCC